MKTDTQELALVAPETAHGDHANAITAMTRKMVIPGDVVNKATMELPDEQRSAIRGMHRYAVDNNLSNGEVGDLIGFSDAVISLIFRGKYTGSIATVAKEMMSFLALEEKRNQGRALPFIHTKLYDEIETICGMALQLQKIGFMFGDNQIGKSECLKHYQRTHNHGSTIYVEMPTGGALCYFIAKLAEAIGIQTQSREVDLRRRIFEAFDDRMLLIVDEADRAVPGSLTPRTALRTFDFISELFNERRCGVVICGNDELKRAVTKGEVATIMKKSWRRRFCGKELPATPSRADLNIFAKACDLPPSAGQSRDLEKKVIEDEALGVWLTLLRYAAILARERKTKMRWEHVHLAYAARNAMEKSTASEE